MKIIFLVVSIVLMSASIAGADVAALGNINQTLDIQLKGLSSAKLFKQMKSGLQCDTVPTANGASYKLCRSSLIWAKEDGNQFPSDNSVVNLTCTQIDQKEPECNLSVSIQK